MSDKPSPLATEAKLDVAKPVDLKITAPEFIPLAKQTTERLPKLTECLSSGQLPESQSSQILTTPEDALSTPTPTSVSSFAQLVNAARDAPPPDSAEVSMMSMTDDDSDISSADVSVAIDSKTPMLPLSDSVLSDLDVSPTGGIGGGVRCGIPKPDQPTLAPTTENRVFEGLVPQDTIRDVKPKYRQYPPQRSCNIHVQNLPSHYEDTELSALCEEFGRIVSVRVFRRPVAAPPNRRLPDGQHSTYGFVLFDNIISAENCVNALRQRYKNIYPSFARLLDTLFAPHAIHDVRLHRQGASDGVRGSVRVSNRLAALQSIEKLSGMQFGASAGGLRVRLAEEVSGDSSDAEVGAAPALPSYQTLPDIQECRTLLAAPNAMEGPLASSTSAPAVASMIGSGLNQLLFASDSNESLIIGSQRLSAHTQFSPSAGRFLASPARLAVPFTPAMASSISMPHVAPRFLNATQSYNLLPSLRVGDVNLPITNLLSSRSSLYACGNATSANLQEKLAVPEPPVIKVSSYASAVKKPIVRVSSPEDQKTKKRKPGRISKRSKGEGEKSSPEAEAKPTLDGKPADEKEPGELKDKSTVPTNKLAEEKKVGTSSPEQSKSVAPKSKKWSATRRRSNSKPATTVKA
ncbi:hypothetical protein FRC07_004941 [Ceratobasidium sp. 392]|nr:hypothetical protein FRC07_004941 [Ceratobasidium sp. 392]